MSQVIDAVIKELASAGWTGLQAINTRLPESASPTEHRRAKSPSARTTRGLDGVRS